MLPPSVTLGVAVRLTVVVSASSVTVVLAVLLVLRASKLPPLVPVIEAETTLVPST